MDRYWTLYKEFFDPGTPIGAAILALLFFFMAYIMCVITTQMVQRPNWVVGKLKRRVDETVILYTVRIKNLLIFLVIGVFYTSLVPGLKAIMGTMVAGAGVTALIMGFAAKSTLANLIAGLSIAVYRPVRIGDMVHIDGEYSTVEDITLRHTIVRTWQYKRLIIPNSKLDEMTVVNYSIIEPKMKCTIEFGVSYDTDIDLARRLILEEAMVCPQRNKEQEEEEPYLRVISHGDFSIGLRLYLWTSDIEDSFQAKFWMYEHVKKRFDREGVEIPFPYRTIVYKNDLPPARVDRGLRD